MTSVDTNAVLNRLLVLHHRSLATYLHDAVPWVQSGQVAARRAIELIVAGQRVMVDRLGEMILQRGGDVDFGRYPLSFTALHDLSFDYLLQRLITDQQQRVAAITECVDALRLVPLAQALAQEARGEAKGHLDALRELAAERNPAGCGAGPAGGHR